jgi:hypothetical protein
MNAVESEEAVSNLSTAPFEAANFPYAFLKAFGNNETRSVGWSVANLMAPRRVNRLKRAKSSGVEVDALHPV